jgi:hypothetical protein
LIQAGLMPFFVKVNDLPTAEKTTRHQGWSLFISSYNGGFYKAFFTSKGIKHILS